MKNLPNETLLRELQRAVSVERAAISEVLQYLAEVEARKLHLARGYSSLWEFATKFLGYSEGEAYARIQAMRLLREVPAAEKELREGNMSLTVAADLRSAFLRENKARAQREEAPLAIEEKQKLFEEVKGKSKREAEVIFQNHLSGTRNAALEKLVVYATPEMRARLEELKALLAHKNFDGDLSKLFALMLETTLRAEKQKRTAEPKRAIKTPAKPASRHIPLRIRREVWRRERHECSYIDPATKRRCASRHALEIDHIQPWSQGGTHDPKNLRLLCAAHNKHRNFENTG